MKQYLYDYQREFEFNDDFREYINNPDNPLAAPFATWVSHDAFFKYKLYPDDDPRSYDFGAWKQDGAVGTHFVTDFDPWRLNEVAMAYKTERIAIPRFVYKIYANAAHTETIIVFFSCDGGSGLFLWSI
ncbi:MAG: hypothetical protein UIG59_00625 [Acutalibacteraceae bacterium]|nr:hypothetical protein [Acutalibacteraceae bacterium]